MRAQIKPCPTAPVVQALPSFVEGIFLPCELVFSTYPAHQKHRHKHIPNALPNTRTKYCNGH